MSVKRYKAKKNEANIAEEPAAYSVAAFCQQLSISQSFFWKLISEKRVRVVRLGRKCLIPSTELSRLLNGEM